nr:DUF1311 domain-containing protein [Conchiformibius kuhniae]
MSPAEIILNRTANNNLRFDGQAVMAQLDYRVNPDPQHFAVNYSDGNLSLLGNVITAALLSYGVKDMIVVNGKPLSRDAALRNAEVPRAQTVIRPDEVETLTPPPPRPEESQRQLAPPETQAPAAETAEAAPPSRVSESRLEAARDAHKSADRDIKNAWHNIEPQIQQGLIEEQQHWENRKNRDCRSAAEKGADDAESQYLHIQCDIRKTRERIKYLDSFSIQ